jgi:hypothetical protein
MRLGPCYKRHNGAGLIGELGGQTGHVKRRDSYRNFLPTAGASDWPPHSRCLFDFTTSMEGYAASICVR